MPVLATEVLRHLETGSGHLTYTSAGCSGGLARKLAHGSQSLHEGWSLDSVF